MSETKEIRKALIVLDNSGPKLTRLLIEKFGTSRAASKAVGITDVHFCNVRLSHTRPSVTLIEAMLKALED